MCLYVFIYICNLGRLAALTAFFAVLSVLLQCDHFVLETLLEIEKLSLEI